MASEKDKALDRLSDIIFDVIQLGRDVNKSLFSTKMIGFIKLLKLAICLLERAEEILEEVQ